MFGLLPIVFDSASYTLRDQIAVAREEYGRKALKIDLELVSGKPFRQRMAAAQFGDVRVAVIQSTPYRVSRTRTLIADGDDRIGLCFPLAGTYAGEQGGKDISAKTSEATTMQGGRTGWFGSATGGTFLTIRAPAALITSFVADPEMIRPGATLRRSGPGLELIRGYLSALHRNGGELPATLQESCGRHLAELGVHALSATGASAAHDSEGLRAARREAALLHMAMHFTDPGYDVTGCARHLGISVRYLQAVLEAGGSTFTESLTQMRLSHARSLLEEGDAGRGRILDIAMQCGFSDVSYFNRLFKRRYGHTPSDARGSRSTQPVN